MEWIKFSFGDILNTFDKTFVDIQKDMFLGDSQNFGTTICDTRL